ncbi:MAG: hypothetical protein RLO04_00515 [Limnobacter sp.]|uniref:hypothetical protein n=1 Tax=Limnobacter sp. TaxID=2003368 RepID=UPI0032EB8D51
MFKWKKYGNIFNPTAIENRPWMKEFAQAPSTLIMDDVVRVYFSCRPAPDERGNYVSLSAYADFNKLNLSELVNVCERPLLELGPLGSFDEYGAYFTSVIRRDSDIVAYYVGYTRCESVPFTINIGGAVSTDGGHTFTRLGPGPILSCTVNEPFFLTVPRVKKFGQRYYMWYSAGRRWVQTDRKPEPVYHIRMATSLDGVHWHKENRDLIPRIIGENECQACPDVFYHDNSYHMFFSYRAHENYYGAEGGYRIGYAWSPDLLNWTRADERAGLDRSESGWDSEMVSFPHVFNLDGDVYMLYLGNQMGRYGFGLAQLVSYDD